MVPSNRHNMTVAKRKPKLVAHLWKAPHLWILGFLPAGVRNWDTFDEHKLHGSMRKGSSWTSSLRDKTCVGELTKLDSPMSTSGNRKLDPVSETMLKCFPLFSLWIGDPEPVFFTNPHLPGQIFALGGGLPPPELHANCIHVS